MRNIFKNTSLAAILSIAILLPSCSGDEATPIDDVPDITLTSSAASTTVWKIVKLTATTTSTQDIDRIEIKIDGASIGTSTTSPYEFSWDTKNATDGPHTIIAIVTDQTGKEKSTELKVTVQNTLLETKIPTDMLRTESEYGYNERGFIFLSDEEGKVIIAQEFSNGDNITLNVPAFEGGEFSVSEVVAQPWNPNYTSTTIYTTTRVSRGKWVMTAPYKVKPTGFASLTFTNRNPNLDYYLTTSWANYYLSGNAISGVNLQTSPGLLYVTSQPKDDSSIPLYHIYPSIVNGSNPNALDLALVNKPLNEETITLPQDKSNGHVMLYGVQTVNGTSQFYHLDLYRDDTKGKLTIQYPGTGFEGFYSFTTLNGPEYSAVNNSKKLYDIVPLTATLNASLAGRKVTLAASGDVDMIYFNLRHNDLSWAIAAEKSTTSFVIPEIPDILNDVVNINVGITNAALTIAAEDYPQIQDYKGYIDFIRASNKGYSDFSLNAASRKSLYKKIKNTSGGRQASSPNNEYHRPGDTQPYPRPY